jgi:prepilin-type N-terminal cleavage/methylation domain-containing protein
MRTIISTNEQNVYHVEKGTASNRSAFTLVELMVVVAIMAVLGALVAGVVVKAIEAQKNSNTKTTMEVIKSALSKQLQAVIDDGKDKERKGTSDITKTVNAAFPTVTDFNSDPTHKNLAKNYQKYISTNPKDTNIATESYLVRMILDAGPFSKLETDMLPKGALATDKPVILDAWGEPIKLTITKPIPPPPPAPPSGTKVIFKLTSDNTSEAVSN